MPRPKPKQSLHDFEVVPHSLSEEESAKLLAKLGYRDIKTMRNQLPGYRVLKRQKGHPLKLKRDHTPSSEAPASGANDAILDIEVALGLGTSSAQHLDNLPRAADYREVFRPLGTAARSLHKSLARVKGYYRDQFALRGADYDAIRQAVASLAKVCDAVVEYAAMRSSKGARRNVALTNVICFLRGTFREYYQGARGDRTRRGAFVKRAHWERHELEFVRLALRFARLIPENFQELPRLFRDPRCRPAEQERNSG